MSQNLQQPQNLPTKYIILCHGRCGSTFLQEELQEIGPLKDEVTSLGEIYNENYIKTIISLDDPYWHERHEKPIEFINYIYSRMGRQTVGSKILYPQINKNGLDILLKSHEYKVIFLYRKNILQAAISMILTHQTQEWHVKKEQFIKIPSPFEVDYNVLDRYIDDITTFITTCKNELKDNFFEVAYEDLINLEKINQICNFLGVSSKDVLTSDTGKQQSSFTYSSILNIHDIENKYAPMYGTLNDFHSSNIEFWKQ